MRFDANRQGEARVGIVIIARRDDVVGGRAWRGCSTGNSSPKGIEEEARGQLGSDREGIREGTGEDRFIGVDVDVDIVDGGVHSVAHDGRIGHSEVQYEGIGDAAAETCGDGVIGRSGGSGGGAENSSGIRVKRQACRKSRNDRERGWSAVGHGGGVRSNRRVHHIGYRRLRIGHDTRLGKFRAIGRVRSESHFHSIGEGILVGVGIRRIGAGIVAINEDPGVGFNRIGEAVVVAVGSDHSDTHVIEIDRPGYREIRIRIEAEGVYGPGKKLPDGKLDDVEVAITGPGPACNGGLAISGESTGAVPPEEIDPARLTLFLAQPDFHDGKVIGAAVEGQSTQDKLGIIPACKAGKKAAGDREGIDIGHAPSLLVSLGIPLAERGVEIHEIGRIHDWTGVLGEEARPSQSQHPEGSGEQLHWFHFTWSLLV